MTLSVYHLQPENAIQKMSDMEDSWLAAAGGVSIGLLALCILTAFVRECRRPRMKESRSDTDLTQLTECAELA